MAKLSKGWTENELVKRVAGDIRPGWIVNLGIGLPSKISLFASELNCLFHSENGIIGMGKPATGEEIDADVINPAKLPVTIITGAAFIDSVISFGIMRGGHLDLSIMGAYQVSSQGDLANWSLAYNKPTGIGGAADLAAGCKTIWIVMTHVSSKGIPKIVDKCTLPITKKQCVSRIYTNYGVFEPAGRTVKVIELAPQIDKSDAINSTDSTLEF